MLRTNDSLVFDHEERWVSELPSEMPYSLTVSAFDIAYGALERCETFLASYLGGDAAGDDDEEEEDGFHEIATLSGRLQSLAPLRSLTRKLGELAAPIIVDQLIADIRSDPRDNWESH